MKGAYTAFLAGKNGEMMEAQDHLKAMANSFWSFHDRWMLLSEVVNWVLGMLVSEFQELTPDFALRPMFPLVQGTPLQINESITCQCQMSLIHCGGTG